MTSDLACLISLDGHRVDLVIWPRNEKFPLGLNWRRNSWARIWLSCTWFMRKYFQSTLFFTGQFEPSCRFVWTRLVHPTWNIQQISLSVHVSHHTNSWQLRNSVLWALPRRTNSQLTLRISCIPSPWHIPSVMWAANTKPTVRNQYTLITLLITQVDINTNMGSSIFFLHPNGLFDESHPTLKTIRCTNNP